LDFLEHGFKGFDTDLSPAAGDFWNTDLMDGTRIFCLRLRFLNTDLTDLTRIF
jgi:hypothetical protein